MKRIGILGGISPESTRFYYEQSIEAYHARPGDCNYLATAIFSLTTLALHAEAAQGWALGELSV